MEILKLSQGEYKNVLKKAVKAIKERKILVCPTDTVYGLICDAINKKAIGRLFKIKNRSKRKPIPIFVRDIGMAKRLVHINDEQAKFLRKHWLGKITVILKKRKELPKGIFGSKKTIGLRIPKYKFINQLLFNINKPLTGTSANVSGKSPSTKVQEILKQFKGKKHQPDLVIDAGNLNPSKPSMVVDLTKGFKVLRR